MAGCCCSSSSQAALQVLLESIVEQLENFNITGGGGTVLTPIELVEWDSATLSSSYSEVLSDTNNKKYIQIENQSDGTVYMSFDGTDDHFQITSGSSKTLDLGALSTFWNENIHLRADTVAVPTSGNILISSFY